jgi:hypothetical protein
VGRMPGQRPRDIETYKPPIKEPAMRGRSTLSLFAFGLLLTSCGGDGEDVEVAEQAPADSASMEMPGMSGGMGAMNGNGAGMMTMADMEAHMAAMRGASGDSLRAMMARHRQMAMQMMATMDSTHSQMGMPTDSAWVATRDSLRMDLDRMEGMSPEQMAAFHDEHHRRMRRMLEMHTAATGARPQ